MKKILLGSLLLFSLLWAQSADRQRFRLVHADKMYYSNSQGGQVLDLSGNVHFFYGDTEFKGRRALILDGPKIARISGNVTVKNDSLFLRADSLAYYRQQEILNLGGKVRLDHDAKKGFERWMQGDHAIYDQGKDQFSVWGNVSAYDEEGKAKAKSGYGFWDRKEGYAYLLEEPVVEVEGETELKITADKMELFEEERKLVATFNVHTYHQDYHISSDFLIYFDNEEKAVFVGEPKFENDFATAFAKEFQLFFEDEKLKQAVLVDSCLVYFASEEKQEKKNWVKAKDIVLNFEDDSIVDFNAELDVSYYFEQLEEEKKDYFENRATGQNLKAYFDADNRLKLMDMTGKIQGVYKFKNDS